MRFSGHPNAHFVKACITQRNGGITVKQQTINGFALFQSGQSAVLPQNRSYIRDSAQKALMAAAKRPVAKLQTLLQNLPEPIHISLRGACHIHQVNGHNTLVETSVELVASIGIALRLLHSQDGTASHTGIYIASL